MANAKLLPTAKSVSKTKGVRQDFERIFAYKMFVIKKSHSAEPTAIQAPSQCPLNDFPVGMSMLEGILGAGHVLIKPILFLDWRYWFVWLFAFDGARIAAFDAFHGAGFKMVVEWLMVKNCMFRASGTRWQSRPYGYEGEGHY